MANKGVEEGIFQMCSLLLCMSRWPSCTFIARC